MIHCAVEVEAFVKVLVLDTSSACSVLARISYVGFLVYVVQDVVETTGDRGCY